jgi:hypothetical protein
MKKKLKKRNCTGFFIGLVSIVVFVWLLASFIDTNICNNPLSERYQDFTWWNIFTM